MNLFLFAMTCYYPTIAIIAAAGYGSFRELYRKIVSQGCQLDEYYTIVYVNAQGHIENLIVPVWHILKKSISEVTPFKLYRRGR